MTVADQREGPFEGPYGEIRRGAYSLGDGVTLRNFVEQLPPTLFASLAGAVMQRRFREHDFRVRVPLEVMVSRGVVYATMSARTEGGNMHEEAMTPERWRMLCAKVESMLVLEGLKQEESTRPERCAKWIIPIQSYCSLPVGHLGACS